MKVYRRLPPLSDRLACTLTIGNFDGVHLGHRALLEQLVSRARAAGRVSCVLTFEPHPREYFAGTIAQAPAAPARIATLRDKLIALEALGIDRVCVSHFNASLAAMPPEDFAREVLFEGLVARDILIGDDFRFGARRRGNFLMLHQIASKYCATVASIETIRQRVGPDPAQRISSSLIREALAEADFDRVRMLLGRPYSLSGRVVHGRKLGRTLGFPTLNLRFPHGRPALAGIFVVKVRGLDEPTTMLDGVASLGTRPAVEADGRYLLEVHIPDWHGDAYGKLLEIEFVHRLRSERHFESLAALTDQIRLDVQAAREHFGVH